MYHSIHLLLAMLKQTGATTTPPQGHSCDLLALIRMILGMSHLLPAYMTLNSHFWIPPLVCAKLASGKMVVSGDQWPMLVYANQEYNPNDP
jgi:hypothetical protein